MKRKAEIVVPAGLALPGAMWLLMGKTEQAPPMKAPGKPLTPKLPPNPKTPPPKPAPPPPPRPRQ